MMHIPRYFLRSALLCVTLAALLACSVATPQQQGTSTASSQSESNDLKRGVSEPYAGELSIFEYGDRDRKLQINRVMDILRIKEGSQVADIGAGSGWFTVRAARRVGASGQVYAVEINKAYLKHIEDRAAKEKLANIRPVLGREDDPLLAEASVDAVLILKTYHEIAKPISVLKGIRRALRSGGRVGIIERNGKGDDHGIDRQNVIKEATQAGFALAEEHDFVKPDDMDYFLVFTAKS